MKQTPLILTLILWTTCIYAQNKTLGVGIANPSPNAALHVESPGSNQGMIMPRLTTAQRTAMILAAGDKGLLVFDTDLNGIFTWDGAAWGTSSKSLPTSVTLSNTDMLNDVNALSITYTGDSSRTLLDLNFANAANPNIANPFRLTHAGQGAGMVVTQSGIGTGATFQVTNPLSPRNAINAFNASDVGGNPAPVAILGSASGIGALGGSFRINNAANPFPALFAESIGTGAGILVNQTTGTGAGININLQNPASSAIGLNVTKAGNGTASIFTNNSPTDGFAGLFINSNPGNTFPAIQGSTEGAGSVFRAIQSTGPGSGMDVFMQNVSSTAPGFSVDHAGLGTGGNFVINNAASPANALRATSNGTGTTLDVVNTGTGDAGSFTSSAGVAGRFTSSASVGLFALSGGDNTSAIDAFKIDGGGNTIQVGHNGANAFGPGNAIRAFVDGGSSIAVKAEIIVPTGTGNALNASTVGTGDVALFNHSGPSGNIAIFQSGGANVARIDKTGQGFFNGGTVTGGADLAEAFEVEGNVASYEPGDVLVISDKTDRTVEKSSNPNSHKVVGVYATKPGVLLTEKGMDDDMGNTIPMGVIGVIPTKVCLENGSIKRGDLLVTSSQSGKAMKAVPAIVNGVEIYPQGAILGKALENFDGSGTGLIKVLVNVK